MFKKFFEIVDNWMRISAIHHKKINKVGLVFS